MTASIRVIVLKSVKAAPSVSSDIPRPTHTSASVIPIDIATAEPSTISSTRIAAAKPSTSLVVGALLLAVHYLTAELHLEVRVADRCEHVVLERVHAPGLHLQARVSNCTLTNAIAPLSPIVPASPA